MIDIKVNDVSIADQVNVESLVVQQNLTNEQDIATFGFILSGDREVPQFDDDIVILDGTTKIFAGKIAEVSEQIAGSLIRMVKVACVDHTLEFDRILAARTYEDETIADILADLIDTYAPTFTYANVASDFVIEKIVFNQVPLSQCVRRLADIVRFDWYIDEDKDLHFFDKFTNTAPYDLTDTGGNYVYKSLVRTSDGSQIVNRVKVRGGEYDGSSYTDIITVVGNDTKSFNLPYKMANLAIRLDTGGGFVAKTVGVDFIDTFDDFDVLYSFQTQSFRFENELSDGDRVEYTGNPKTPVLAVVEDAASIAALRARYEEAHGEAAPAGYGIIEKIIKETAIASNTIARQRAAAELIAFADAIVDAQFTTYTPGLRAGMVLHMQSDLRGFDEDLIIKKVQFKARTPEDFEYTVQCISTQRFTLLEVLRKIVTPESRPEDEKEVSESAYVLNETVNVLDEWTQVNPFVIEESVTFTDAWLDLDGDDIVWVWGYYAPASHSDVNRMARWDRDAKWQ